MTTLEAQSQSQSQSQSGKQNKQLVN